MSLARRVRVTGRVQGVWFRAWTQDQANELGIAGWVRNCDDGAVEAHIEGGPDPVDRLIEKMRSGPPAARVDNLQLEDVAPEGLTGFAVRE